MQVTLEWMNLTYEAEFSAPSFDLPGQNTLVLKSLYERINPRYPIRPTEMQVTGGNVLSDVRVRVTLFQGNGVLEITVDKLSCVFSYLRTKEDVTTCKDCISLSEQALRTSLPDVSIRAVALKPNMVFQLGGGLENAASHLSRMVGANTEVNLSGFGNAVQHSGVNREIENSEEGWDAIFHAFRDRTHESSLFVTCHALYSENGAIRALEDRANHLEQLLSAFLESIGLQFADST